MSPSQSKPQLPKQTIRRQTNGGVTPLSFGQQGMWFLQQMNPASPVYNTYRLRRVRGALNTDRPRGIEGEHRQVVYYLGVILERLNFAVDSSFATVLHLTTDLGNTMVYLALVTGGASHIISEDLAADPAALRITGMYF
jgi:hypothetical protein